MMRPRPASRRLAPLLVLCLAGGVLLAFEPCRFEVVEKETGWPVPLVELRTVNEVRFVSDNAGVIAFDLPEWMGVETWFEVRGQGYEVPKDGFGLRGVRLKPEPGQTLRVTVERRMIARRIGRLTGAGLFGESQRFGEHLDWVDSGVAGCDSVRNAVHEGRLFWIWGDTSLPRYPLGLFHASAATTEPRPLTSFEPPLRLAYDYFTDAERRPRNVAEMPGDGPTWLDGMISLPDRDGKQHLVAAYTKIRPPLEPYRSGLCEWDSVTSRFKPLALIWQKSDGPAQPPPMPYGHAMLWKDEEGRSWAMFGDPFPKLRCPATFEAYQKRETWQTLTAPATVPEAGSQTAIRPHRGTIAWNAHRKRWVTVFVREAGETSYLGEVYYAEADAPSGPWGPAIKVLWHDNYTFYNPCMHPDFTDPDSPVLLFEATYTRTFADKPEPTPRYDYNQVLYRLDLDDPRLVK